MGGFGYIKRFWCPRLSDTRAMNTVLLARWNYKLDRGEESMALEVLKKKYLKSKSICQSKVRGGTQFWQV